MISTTRSRTYHQPKVLAEAEPEQLYYNPQQIAAHYQDKLGIIQVQIGRAHV